MSKGFQITVKPLPAWLDWKRLLGPGEWNLSEGETTGALQAEAVLERDQAADLAARLRGVGIGGALLKLEIQPPLNRKELRRANTDEARRHRERSPGFTRSSVQLDDEARLSLTPEALALDLGERLLPCDEQYHYHQDSECTFHGPVEVETRDLIHIHGLGLSRGGMG